MDSDESLPEDGTIPGIYIDVKNADESEGGLGSEAPVFLRPEFHDIFPLFASMLDIKSLMKIAMTNKEMYKLSTMDKNIILRMESANFMDRNDTEGCYFSELHFKTKRNDNFLNALRKCAWRINIEIVYINQRWRDCSFINATGQCLKEIGVNRVNSLDFPHYHSQRCFSCNSEVCEAVAAFIKEFHVKSLLAADLSLISLPFIRTMLKQNLNHVEFNPDANGTVFPIDFLLEVSSPILEVVFAKTNRFSRDVFMELISRIQAGSFHRLIIPSYAVDWSGYAKLSFGHDGPLPDYRPLLFVRSVPQKAVDEYWFLHENGCCTKCVDKRGETLTISKCEPCDSLRFTLRNNENVLMDLKERRPTVFCNDNQFHSFTAGRAMMDSSHEGCLPEERPLHFKLSENRFLMLDEDDHLMSCTWDSGCAVWDTANLAKPLGHPTLAKYTFWRLAKDSTKFPLKMHCENRQEFHSWFEDHKLLNYEDCDSPLKDERPVVFERQDDRIILFQDYCVHCNFRDNSVTIEDLPVMHRPWILNTAEAAKILQRSLKHRSTVISHDSNERREFFVGYGDFRVDLQMFRDGFDLFKTLPLDYFHPQQHVVAYANTTKSSDGEIIEELFYATPGDIIKATWKKGRFMVSPAQLREAPLNFVKQCFKLFAQKQARICQYLELDQFRSCLEQFICVPFDHAGELTEDSPLAFVKNEIHHSCSRFALRDLCPCPVIFISVWILWEDMLVTYCSWGARTARETLFEMPHVSRNDVPSALTSTEFLKFLLQRKYTKKMEYRWFGSSEDFRVCLSDKLLPSDYDGPLPEERPLFFDFVFRRCGLFCFLLREDGTVIKCSFEGSYFALFLPSLSDSSIPPALRSFL